MADVVGNDFSAVQGAQDAANNLRQRQFESAFQNVLASRAQQFQQGLANRELALRTSLGTGELGLRQQQLAAEQQHFAALMAHYQAQGDVSRGYLDAYNRQLDWQQKQPTQAGVRGQDFAANYLMDAAARGEIDSPEHAAAMAPGLDPSFYQLAAARSASQRPVIAQSFDQSNRAAALLNAYDHANYTIGNLKAPPTISTNPIWGDNAASAAKKKEIQDAFTVRDHLKNTGIIPSLQKSNLAMPDETGTWQPTVPQPRWMRPTTAPVGPQALGQEPYWSEQEASGGGAGASSPSGAPGAPPPRSMSMSVGAPVPPGLTAYVNQSQPQFHPLVYQRANQLLSTGMPPDQAWQQAKADWQTAGAAGNLP